MRVIVPSDEVSRISADLWLQLVKLGEVRVPFEVIGPTSYMLLYALRLLSKWQEIELHVDTKSGDEVSFEAAKELKRRKLAGQQTTVYVDGCAHSIGLSYVAPGTHRVATPTSTFLAHGDQERVRRSSLRHANGSLMEDHYIADWLAQFTLRTYDEWLEFVSDGEYHKFGAEQAREWGVIDEIREGV